jgi:hypothetical protein
MSDSSPPLAAKSRGRAVDLAIASAYVTTSDESLYQSAGLIAMIAWNAPGRVAATSSANSPPAEWPASIVIGSVRYLARTIGSTWPTMYSANAAAPPAVLNSVTDDPVAAGNMS